MTTIPHIATLINTLLMRQLVLFPELLGVTSVPLGQWQQSQREPAEEPTVPRLTVQEALAAGQMLLWLD